MPWNRSQFGLLLRLRRWSHLRHNFATSFMNILQALKTHDKVIGISHHEGPPLTRGLNGFHEPFVQHLVQIDVTEQFLGTYPRLTGGAW
jgi:hypothetical protein